MFPRGFQHKQLPEGYSFVKGYAYPIIWKTSNNNSLFIKQIIFKCIDGIETRGIKTNNVFVVIKCGQ